MDGSDRKMYEMFAYLDEKGSENVTASAEVVLKNGNIMTVSAGGPGVHSAPAWGPFEAYEVLLDHEPPRFWKRYVGETALFVHVPRLLVTHHIIRRGGIAQLAVSCSRKPRQVRMSMELTVDEDSAKLVREAVEHIASTNLISSLLTFQ